MADNLFDLAAASEAAKQQAASADFLADADFGAFLDPAKGYTFQELQDEYASFRAARELAGEGLDDEDDDVERDMSKCSYALGYIKQEVFGCKTCAVEGGICVCCYHSCHNGHELFPVDPKRHFRCDCPTSTFAVPCTLSSPEQAHQLATTFGRPPKLAPNAENTYGQNFRNLFCWCAKEYGDESVAAETMIQCVLCEEWLHESHLNLKQPSRVPLPPLNANAEDPSAPPVLLRDGEYAALVCESCVLAPANAPLADYFGTARFVGLVRGADGKWDRVGYVEGVDDEDDTDDEDASGGAGGAAKPTDGAPASPIKAESSKRPLPASSSGAAPAPPAKKARVESVACTRPAAGRDTRATALLETRRAAAGAHNGWGTGRCDVFVQPGFRRALCQCDEHRPLADKLPALFGRPVPTWQPPPLAAPADADAAAAALMPQLVASLGHAGAVDGVRAALTGMADFGKSFGEFVGMLGPPGTTVTKADVDRFTEAWKAKMDKAREARARE